MDIPYDSANSSAARQQHHHHYHHYHLCTSSSGAAQRRLLTSGVNSIPNNPSSLDVRNVPNSATTTDVSPKNNYHSRKPTTRPLMQVYSSIKTLSLSHLTAKQHLLMAICRDVSLLPPLTYMFTSLQRAWQISFQAKTKLYEPQSLKDTITCFVENYVANNSTSTFYNGSSNGSAMLLSTLTTARASEYLLCSLWCIVSLYLTYSILDSLMVRWIVKYSTLAAILRMFSMSLIIVTLELLLLASLSPQGDYYLHTWILLSCVLTGAYIWQNYLTSNLNYVSHDDYEEEPEQDEPTKLSDTSDFEEVNFSNSSTTSLSQSRGSRSRKGKRKLRKTFKFTKKRTVDLYNIIVFCVVPVGLASFITMIGLLRNLVIQRLDVEQLGRILQATTFIAE